jgi:hypothetical protein
MQSGSYTVIETVLRDASVCVLTRFVRRDAWLEFVVERDGSGSRVTQSALFDPVGIWGRAYWYGVYPFHNLIFQRMLSAIARRAEHEQRRRPEPDAVS